MVQRLRVLCLLGAGVLLAPAVLARASDGARAIPLGVQSCDTECQSTETDCDLACDQVVACVEECKKASESCVQKCREAPPPASKPDSPAKPSAPAGKKPPAKNATKPKPKAA